MEGTAEAHETTDTGGSKEAPHIKSVENDQLPQQPGSHNALETPGLVVSRDTDWSEHFSILRSPEIVLETSAGRNFNFDIGSQASFRPLCASPYSKKPTVKVEDPTLQNNKSPNLSLNGGSSSGELLARKILWPNFTMLAGRPREKAPREHFPMGHKDAEGSGYFPPLGSQRPLPCMQLEPKASKISEHIAGVDNYMVLSNSCTISPREIQSKVLSASGFQQFFNRSSLKGKGVAYKHQESHDVLDTAIPAQTIQRPNTDTRIAYNSSRRPSGKADSINLFGGGDGGVGASHHEGISLRECLKPKRQRINKVERMHLFKQILNLVDASHSQGLALQHLRPSYFLVLPSNQIKYIGSFTPQGQIEMLSASGHQNVHRTEHLLKRKMHMEQDEEAHEVLELKYQKLADDCSITYPRQSGFRERDQCGENEVTTSGAGNSRCDFTELIQCKLYKACGISSATSSQQSMSEVVTLEEGWYASPEELDDHISSFSSNIYSLGVLFFELFFSSEKWEVHCAAMSDLRLRILPPNFLSEDPKEASFCIWLLHPKPYFRPKSRDVISSDLVNEGTDLSTIDHSSALIEEEDTEANLLLHFLLSLKEKKEKQAAYRIANLECIRTDLEEVKRRHSLTAEFFSNGKDLSTNFSHISEFCSCEKPVICAETMTRLSMSSLYKERLMKNIDQLENAYFSMRFRIETSGPNSAIRSDTDILKMRDGSFQVQNDAVEKESDESGIFFEGLCKFARYSKFEVRGSIKNVDILNSANVICSLSLDRDEDYFAAAGVSKKIKIFEFSSLLNDTVDIHYPLIEMSSRSKLSCVCWNSYIKNYLASTDYEGVVQLWDASTGQGFTQFTEHQKRAWSVNFSQVDPTKLASGSDDFSVKLWSINEKKCINTIRIVANVCCVQFSPYSSHLLSFGSADYRIYCFDLRNTKMPWCTLVGHQKAVSYVKFLDSETLVSASTDNTLKIWDLKRTSASELSSQACRLTLSGHTNEKNFVGLSVCDGYIACGSETNEVYAYYRTCPTPITSHKFGSIDPITAQETSDDGGQFVSSVCWRGKSNMVVAANSTGGIKVLQLV